MWWSTALCFNFISSVQDIFASFLLPIAFSSFLWPPYLKCSWFVKVVSNTVTITIDIHSPIIRQNRMSSELQMDLSFLLSLLTTFLQLQCFATWINLGPNFTFHCLNDYGKKRNFTVRIVITFTHIIFTGGQRQKRLKYTFRMTFQSYLLFHLPLEKERW